LIQDVNSPEELNISVKTLYNYLNVLEGNPKETSPEKLVTDLDNVVDVRDVALAHVEALINPKAGGERFLVSSSPSSFWFLCFEDNITH
jgi:nucleoside-diphosphate-sugar epimerase